MLMSIAETELISYLVGETADVNTICNMIESCSIWFSDYLGTDAYFNDIFADVKDSSGKTTRYCISEDSRELDDDLLLKVKSISVTDNWDVLLDAELTITE